MFSFLKEYFKLSNLEQKGALALIFLTLCLFSLPKLYQIYRKPVALNSEEFEKWTATFKTEKPSEMAENTNLALDEIDNPTPVFRLFSFNPNTVSKSELIELGISEKTAGNLINYRNKGGRFYKREDILKIYGFKESDYERLKNYIVLDTPSKDYPKYEKAEKPKTAYTPQPVNINLADSAEFTKLKGIGPVFASRIVKYRNSLGGFIDKTQFLEIYGFTDSLYQSLEPMLVLDEITIKKININLADLNELKKHPYIDYNTALAIVKYREQNGLYASKEDLNGIYSLSQNTINKIKPYITTE